ncbi:hypothetical protein ACGFT2_05995 [Streptomyces sp. NPDC048514]|uniref:hypothetical protein n=1 Tax=Streptomyces sp. NPDC048514 TaxID=3365564 RepID=UPI003722729F
MTDVLLRQLITGQQQLDGVDGLATGDRQLLQPLPVEDVATTPAGPEWGVDVPQGLVERAERLSHRQVS